MATGLYNHQVLEDGLRNVDPNLSRAQIDRIHEIAEKWLNNYDPRKFRLTAAAQVTTHKIFNFFGGGDSGSNLLDTISNACSKLFSGDFSGCWDTLKTWWSGSTGSTDRAGSTESIVLAMHNINTSLKLTKDPQLAAVADYLTSTPTNQQSWSLYYQAMRSIDIPPETSTDLPIERRRFAMADTTTVGPAPVFRASGNGTLTTPSRTA